MMKFVSLCSGSKGNCTVLYYKNYHILIDCGSSQKYITTRLKELNLSVEDINLVLITHAHGDHVKSIKMFKDKKILSCSEVDYAHQINYFKTLLFNGLKITAIPLSHDSKNTCGFVFESNFEKLVYITDTGYVSKKLYALIHNADYYFIESNHDVAMLMKTSRPFILKNRILSDSGHLCNEDCTKILKQVIGPSTKEIILAHLSEEANTPSLAFETVNAMIKEHLYNTIVIKIAPQFELCKGGSWHEETEYPIDSNTTGMGNVS